MSRKTLPELGLCTHDVHLGEQETDLALALEIDLDAWWDKGYKKASTEGKTRLEMHFAGDASVHVPLECMVRMLYMAKTNDDLREKITQVFPLVFDVSDEQTKKAIRLIDDEAFWTGYKFETVK